jgi:hypothetical protein
VTADRSGFLDEIIGLLGGSGVRFCLVGGQAVNAYVEPVVSLDLDMAVAAEDLPRVEQLVQGAFRVARFPHSLNVSKPGSDLRVQIQTDPRYGPFVHRASPREVLGLVLPVAAVEDVLLG